MRDWCRKLVLLLVLAVTPLQGIASYAASLQCHSDSDVLAPHMVHAADGHNHDHASDRDGQANHDDNGNAGARAMGHSCFHHYAPALPVVTLPAVMPEYTAQEFVTRTQHEFFVPDRPQRPPLA